MSIFVFDNVINAGYYKDATSVLRDDVKKLQKTYFTWLLITSAPTDFNFGSFVWEIWKHMKQSQWEIPEVVFHISPDVLMQLNLKIVYVSPLWSKRNLLETDLETLTDVDLLISLWMQTVQKRAQSKKNICCMCKCSWLDVNAHCVSATGCTRVKKAAAAPLPPLRSPGQGRGWSLNHLSAAGARDEPAAPEGICGAPNPGGGSPARPWWTIQCKTARKVSFRPGSLTLMQQNKVLQLAGEKTSVTKQESQLKTQGNARPPLKRRGWCNPAVITWRPCNQEVLIKLLLLTFTGLKNITFKGSFSPFLPNKKAARGLVQETCPHRHHTRRQGVFFWVNVLRLPLPTSHCSV